MIGNVDGVLAIFKGDKATKPWKKCSELGTVRECTSDIKLITNLVSYVAKIGPVTCIESFLVSGGVCGDW